MGSKHREPDDEPNTWQRMGIIGHLMREVEQQLRTLLESNAALELQLSEQKRGIAELRSENLKLTKAKDDLERRLDELTAQQLRGSPNVSTADTLGHQDLANRFGTFVKQDLPTLLRPLCGDMAIRPLAMMTRNALSMLFVQGVDTAETLLKALDVDDREYLVPASKVCAIAAQLRKTAADLSNPQGWTFDCTPGTKIDNASQVEWRACDPHASIEFVVIPGYQTGQRVYLLQEVFTSV